PPVRPVRAHADAPDPPLALRDALPIYLPAVVGIKGGEEEGPVDVGQEAGIGPGRRVLADVLDHHRAGGGAVALPQLAAVYPVVGREEEHAGPAVQIPGRGVPSA